MISAVHGQDSFVLTAVACVAERIGFDPASVSAVAVQRVLGGFLGLGLGPDEILRRAAESDSEVYRACLEALCVGETYFFRHAEQLDRMRELVAARARERPLRVWSAGCSTGEEVYTVAGCLRDVAPHGLEVLGTDVVEEHVRAARRAVYGPWSLRGAAALAVPWLERVGDRVHVGETVRAAARFEVHNVLHAPPGGAFDVILCRNVLVYFSPAAAREACSRLADALSPGGLLVLGPVDAMACPPGLEPERPSWGSIFRKSSASSVATTPPEAPALPPPKRVFAEPRIDSAPRGRRPRAASDSVQFHLDALVRVERGEDEVAEALLERTRPSYVPGLLERALLRSRRGQRAAAERLMEEVLARTNGLPDAQVLDGPEPLTVEFYRSTASTYLARRAGRRVR